MQQLKEKNEGRAICGMVGQCSRLVKVIRVKAARVCELCLATDGCNMRQTLSDSFFMRIYHYIRINAGLQVLLAAGMNSLLEDGTNMYLIYGGKIPGNHFINDGK